MAAANVNQYRLTRDVLIPKGTNVVFVSHMKAEVYRVAMALVRINPDMIYEWHMQHDDALAAGFIEKVENA